jgi:hypothetical protein
MMDEPQANSRTPRTWHKESKQDDKASAPSRPKGAPLTQNFFRRKRIEDFSMALVM